VIFNVKLNVLYTIYQCSKKIPFLYLAGNLSTNESHQFVYLHLHTYFEYLYACDIRAANDCKWVLYFKSNALKFDELLNSIVRSGNLISILKKTVLRNQTSWRIRFFQHMSFEMMHGYSELSSSTLSIFQFFKKIYSWILYSSKRAFDFKWETRWRLDFYLYVTYPNLRHLHSIRPLAPNTQLARPRAATLPTTLYGTTTNHIMESPLFTKYTLIKF
jgi:hypothetical protein